MASEFTSCPVCMEDHDLEERLPKSLDCRHSVCQACLMGNGHPLTHCPLCRKRIAKPSNVPNDWTMIDYLGRTAVAHRENEDRAVRETLLRLAGMAGQEERRIQNLLAQLGRATPEAMKKKVVIFEYKTKSLIRESRIISGHEPTKFKPRAEKALNHKLDVIRTVVSDIDSLLVKASISKEEFHKCHHNALKSIRTKYLPESSDGILWDVYSQILLDHFSKGMTKDISDETKYANTGRI